MDAFKEFVQGIGALCENLKLFYDSCVKAGFCKEEAFELTRDYMSETFNSAREINNGNQG